MATTNKPLTWQVALHYLLENGWSKDQVAERAGVSWRSVHRWATAAAKPKSALQRRAIVEAAQELWRASRPKGSQLELPTGA